MIMMKVDHTMKRREPIVDLLFFQLLIFRREGWLFSFLKESKNTNLLLHSFRFQHCVLIWVYHLFTCSISSTSVVTLNLVPLGTGVSLSKITVLSTTCWLQSRGISEAICFPPEEMRKKKYFKNPRKKFNSWIYWHSYYYNSKEI